ncbi:MAG: hypothetical protein DMD60_04530 [Gemmatimonadetes bacterium]|nr:MAG: hypothetical protein DMD60_04530 [Gemmatimonadota bacterium]
MGLAGVVLAGGASERMGRPKALLDFRGRPFAVRILEALEALDVKTRVVVLGPDAARVRPSLASHECIIVENPDLAGEAIGSLRAALAALESIRPSAVVAWPVDLRGQPVIWDQALFAELASSAAATTHGAGAVLAAHERDLVTLAVDDPAVIDDLNTPEDYERLVRELNRDIY